MSSAQLYDTLGATYTVTRRTEPRIAAQLWAALGDARTVLNVGAGTGSYEPPDREVTAVEPSAVMRAQRPPGPARCVAATAESLPFEDQSFDARWLLPRFITGEIRLPACARCGALLAAW
jgi:SAM-dependent methyltransferase